MSSHLLSEWVAFFTLENEEQEKAKLPHEAIQGIQEIKAKTKRKR